MSASPMAATSVSMWAASDSSASESARSPTTTSTTMNAEVDREGEHEPPGAGVLAHPVGVALVVVAPGVHGRASLRRPTPGRKRPTRAA